MCGDLQHFTIILYILCYEIVVINSRTSTLWKLNPEKNKIIEASPFYQIASHSIVSNRAQFITEDDPLFNIITSTELLGQAWTKQSVQYYCTNCHNAKSISINASTNNSDPNVAINSNSGTKHDDEPLDCGKPVNFTYYDNLVGVVNRNRHPNVPEPQAALSFSKKSQKGKYTGKSELDIDALERRLKKAKKEKPKSVQLYNQIGNFWRIKGNAEKAIECFRRALAVAPHNAEVLLNLARVLFALQYLDDAIYLTRRSLEVQSPDKSAWHQYFTLGEIFKAYGHYQEASIHLRHTLELNPGYVPALLALREMESMPTATIHIYTLVIIICLVLGVLLVILSSVDNIVDYSEAKPQRHFNKAMAMRSLRGFGMSQKRCKKIAG